MARLLETQLPLAYTEVSPDMYNRMVRVLQINLDRFDPTATPQYTELEITSNKFNAGDVIWNTSANSLQLWTGSKWAILYINKQPGVEGVGAVSTLSVSTNTGGSSNANITVPISAPITGWDKDTYYT